MLGSAPYWRRSFVNRSLPLSLPAAMCTADASSATNRLGLAPFSRRQTTELNNHGYG